MGGPKVLATGEEATICNRMIEQQKREAVAHKDR